MQPHFTELPPLSLYVHIPWCVRKCPYCDFNSHEKFTVDKESRYVDTLIADLEQELDFVQGRELSSIFFGGGTPSLFSADSIHRILNGANQRIAFKDDIEITLEANPGTVEQDKFSGFAQAGVNRLSIGVQSFHDEHLKILGRIHDNAEALKAGQTAKAAGIDNFNIDLMHGLPQQTTAQATADIEQALTLQPTHISWYQLTIEKNTAFYSQPPPLPDEDNLHAIAEAGEKLLAENGYIQYEVSAYAKANHRSRHNLNYWQFGDYIGIGAGAHGKITVLDSHEIIRRQKSRQPDDYMSRADYCSKAVTVAPCELSFEFMLNALRLTDGFDLTLFESRSGLSQSVIKTTLEQLEAKSLIQIENNKLRTTALGQRYLNSVMEAFLEG